MANDDAVFAAHAASGLRHAEHVVLPQADMPSIFADADAVGDTEAPYRFTRTLARTRHNATLLASHGAQQHLAVSGILRCVGGPPRLMPTSSPVRMVYTKPTDARQSCNRLGSRQRRPARRVGFLLVLVVLTLGWLIGEHVRC